MTRKGLLLVLADPAPAIEEEFNDWYDSEHLPERAVLPGFETAKRFVCVSGGPAYAALYDLSSLAALDSEPYRAVSGDRFSPWTRRVAARVRPERIVAERIEPDDEITGPCARLLLTEFAGAGEREAAEIMEGFQASFSGSAGHLGTRIFAGREPRSDTLLAIATFSSLDVPPLQLEAFGASGRRITLAAVYRPYRR